MHLSQVLINIHSKLKTIVIEIEEQICWMKFPIVQVKKFSYTTSTENSTSSPKLWSLERNCTNKCEPGCIVIGERTKLYSCTTCCETSLCNIGTGTANELTMKKIHFLLALTLQAIITMILYQSWYYVLQ